jgi:RNA polymerase-binding transcription factor
MDKETVHELQQLLGEKRKQFLGEFRRAEEGLVAIAEERESELEEHAQEEQSARFLTRLDDRTLFAVKEIDAALQRIIKGAYGVCENCREAIPIDRLRSLPATRVCTECAAQSEAQPPSRGAAVQPAPKASIPADLALLDDRELAESIREHLEEDGRIDFDELHVVCRKGVAYLTGVLPSEAEHQILLETLTDVMGLKEIVDRLEIEDLVWQTEKRTRGVGPEIIPRWQEPPGSEDIVESAEEDKEFVAPAKPTPSEE